MRRVSFDADERSPFGMEDLTGNFLVAKCGKDGNVLDVDHADRERANTILSGDWECGAYL
jgi:hypothetical protein